MHAVVAEQMGVGLDAAEVVDGDDFDVAPAALDDGAQYQATDAPEPVDCDLHGHVSFFPFATKLSDTIRRPTAS